MLFTKIGIVSASKKHKPPSSPFAAIAALLVSTAIASASARAPSLAEKLARSGVLLFGVAACALFFPKKKSGRIFTTRCILGLAALFASAKLYVSVCTFFYLSRVLLEAASDPCVAATELGKAVVLSSFWTPIASALSAPAAAAIALPDFAKAEIQSADSYSVVVQSKKSRGQEKKNARAFRFFSAAARGVRRAASGIVFLVGRVVSPETACNPATAEKRVEMAMHSVRNLSREHASSVLAWKRFLVRFFTTMSMALGCDVLLLLISSKQKKKSHRPVFARVSHSK